MLLGPLALKVGCAVASFTLWGSLFPVLFLTQNPFALPLPACIYFLCISGVPGLAGWAQTTMPPAMGHGSCIFTGKVLERKAEASRS